MMHNFAESVLEGPGIQQESRGGVAPAPLEPVVPVRLEASAAPPAGQPPDLEPEQMSHYERLASRVLFADTSERFTLVVASALAGEGVTSTCVGVALALAGSTNKSVLLIDANLRRPALHERFQIPQHPGLHEMIPHAGSFDEWIRANRASLRSLGVSPTTVPNLFVVPAGATLESPTQLMTSDACRACFGFLASRFAYVVVDCPPLLTAVDAGSVCRMGTGIAIVIRTGMTLRDDVRRAQERLQGAPVMGVVLNGG